MFFLGRDLEPPLAVKSARTFLFLNIKLNIQ
jgi:hypothetical protein